MASIRDIRQRIKVVRNIQKITNAMKMVAAARLKKAQDRAMAARPYADTMGQVMENLSRAAASVDHPLLRVRPEENIGVIVIGADRGLAGSYNSNVMRATVRFLRDRDPDTVRLVLLGRKALDFFRRRRYSIAETLSVPTSNVTFADIRPVAAKVRDLFESAEVDAVYLVYSQFVTAMTQRPTVLKLLPIEPAADELAPSGEFIFEPGAEQLFGALLPRYVDTQIYRALVEAVASEHGARMTAMAAATTNAADMIDSLSLTYNKARQAAITKEITEIVSAAEALV
ncbi:MAG: ATP synthase F1 subunit gamma [Armatimonadota bacterium]|nr:ATP synthase F1 subunit gamma [Armatimonadota bacterium]